MPEASENSRSENYLTWLLLLSAAVLIALLALPLWTNRLYTYNDFFAIHVPFRYCYWKALAAGDEFLWTPQYYCGYYIHAEGEVGMCHPLHWLLYKTFPFTLAFNLEFILNYAWLFAGMFFLLRRWSLPRPAALVGSLIFTFSGFSVFHFMHINALGVVSQLPWLLLACDVLTVSKDLKSIALAQLAVALTASQHLMGYPQFVVFSLIAEGTLVLWQTVTLRAWRRIPLFALAIALGFAIAAIQLLPTWDSLSSSDRAETSLAFRMWFSMHPLNLVQLWAPLVLQGRYYSENRIIDGNTHEMGLYTTAFATVALAWLAIRWRRLPQRRFVLATFLFGAGMLVLATGKYAGVYPYVAELPIVRSLPLRCPTRYSMLTELSMAILAAYAMADLLALQRSKERIPWRSLWPLAIPLGLSAATIAVVLRILAQPDHPWAPLLSSTTYAWISLALIATAVGLVAAAARGGGWALYGIVLLTAAESGVFGIWKYVWESGPPATLQSIVDSISPRPPPNTGRLCHVENDHGNMLAVAGYDLMRGYTALIPKQKLPLVVRTPSGGLTVNPWALQVASIHWVLMNDRWLAFPSPLPRARMVAETVVSNNEFADIQKINPATTALVDRAVDVAYGPPGTATITTDRPGVLAIDTSSATRQLLVVSEAYHPGWQATVDGQPAQVVPAYGEYLGCVVPAGARHVALHFVPPSFTWGVRITLAGLAMALSLAVGTVLWAGRHPIAASISTAPHEAISSRPRSKAKGGGAPSHRERH